MAKSIGEIAVTVKADRSQLDRDLQQLPAQVDAAARQASEKARVTIRGHTDPALGLSADKQAQLRAAAVDKRVADMERRQISRQETEIINNQVRARLVAEGKDPSKYFKPDAADKQFARFIADRNAGDDAAFKQFIEQRNDRRQQRFENWQEGLRRNGPELSDRARMNGGSFGSPNQPSLLGRARMLAGGAALGATVAMIGDAIHGAMQIPGINARRDVAIGALENEASLRQKAGLGTASLGLARRSIEADADLQKLNSTAVGRFIGEMTGATAAMEAHSRALKAGAAAVDESNRNFRQLGIRVSQLTFGSRSDPIKMMAAQQSAELADFEERAAKRIAESNNSVEVVSALALERVRLKFAQREEMAFARDSYFGQNMQLVAERNLAQLGIAQAGAELRGSARDQFITGRAAERLKLSSDQDARLIGLDENQAAIVRQKNELELQAFDMRSMLGARSLLENPAMAIATGNTEGLGAWFDRGTDVQLDIKTILERIYEVLATQSL
jgi:hypothetical protein